MPSEPDDPSSFLAPKARQPRWQIAPCAQHAFSFLSPQKIAAQLTLDPIGTSDSTAMATAKKNKSEKGVPFFVSHEAPFRDHVTTHSTPHFHHKNTTFYHQHFPKHPRKTPIKRKKSPGTNPGLFPCKIAN
jgi:hypothetical protein